MEALPKATPTRPRSSLRVGGLLLTRAAEPEVRMEFQQKSQRVSLLPSLPFPPGTAARPVPPTAPRMASLTPPERKELWLCQCLCALPTGEGARGVAPAATRTPSPGRAEVVRRGAAAWRAVWLQYGWHRVGHHRAVSSARAHGCPKRFQAQIRRSVGICASGDQRGHLRAACAAIISAFGCQLQRVLTDCLNGTELSEGRWAPVRPTALLPMGCCPEGRQGEQIQVPSGAGSYRAALPGGHTAVGGVRFGWGSTLPPLPISQSWVSQALWDSMQSFPSIIGAFLSVSYESFATGSGLSAIRCTKKRQLWCQSAYCSKCRFFFVFLFFPSKQTNRRKTR